MTVVVAYSPDDPGRAAVEHGLAEAQRRDERLVVVNATKGDALVDTRFAHEGEVAALRDRLASLDLDAEVRQVVADDVADEVLTVAEDEKASLLVVGIRRRTPVGKLILGSVAQRVILGASCPVLAVKS